MTEMLENGTSEVSMVPTNSGISETLLRPKYFLQQKPQRLSLEHRNGTKANAISQIT